MTGRVLPFRIETPDEALVDLRLRLERTRWPDPETVDDWSQGIPVATVQRLCRYWADGYDWRRTEQRLNAIPQGITEIDGCDIHFLHIRSPEAGALPLIITHGWPGSVLEFLKVIGPLTDPVAHGGDAADAFHVVCPSLPGYGFSGKPVGVGWGVGRIARAWAELMVRLGYTRFGAQGGDWGAAVTSALARHHADRLAGIHLTMPVVSFSRLDLSDLTDGEQVALDSLAAFQKWESGYSALQSTRPQTLGYGLADSPAAQCAWIVEKFGAWTDSDGDPEQVLTRDELLDNVMLYWLTGSGTSSARLYWESFDAGSGHSGSGPVDVPTGCSIFPREIIRLSRRWAEVGYSDLRYWNELDRGGHFAALEQPALFVGELRSFFRLVR